MFRYRRYRVFLVFAVIVVVALYKFGRSGSTWRDAASTATQLKNEAEDALGLGFRPRPPVAHETKKLELHIPVASSSLVLETPPPPAKVNHAPTPPTPVVTGEVQDKPSIPVHVQPHPHAAHPPQLSVSQSALTSIEPIHWTKLPENFPVPTESLIKLPTGKPKLIPRIQSKFPPEDEAIRASRLARLEKIRSVFKKSWDGYTKFAWLHDELRPQSGSYKDPFANWGATLVDTLDTLWIMGFKTEFEEAARAVDQIDFTTTPRADIPLFETTIRYLGGLLAAYDVSGHKYKNLLDKAIELANVLISAFDTPNRMPETYYYWRPQFASQRHRAGIRVVLAEIGSLSMEFTRLAQLTGEHRFYDAIARITDNLEEFQNRTRLPGMWPTYLDASGCGKAHANPSPQKPLRVSEDLSSPALSPVPIEQLSPGGNRYIPLEKPDPVVLTPNGVNPTFAIPASSSALSPSPIEKLSPDGNRYIPLEKPDPVILSPGGANPTFKLPNNGAALASMSDNGRRMQSRQLLKRQLDSNTDEFEDVTETGSMNLMPMRTSAADPTMPTPPQCVPQGFMPTSDYGREEYTLGGMSDSTYEYLPKQYLLLGGNVEKYRTMYEASAKVITDHLIFRPMLPDDNDILFSGKLHVPSFNDPERAGDLEGENAHLTCFAGGMLGMAAKIFDRAEDLEIAKKLTEGCVWSYNMTQSGIMPESFEVVPCKSAAHCAWNETLYWETIDPRSDYRLTAYKEQLELYNSQLASASSWYAEQLAAVTAPSTPSAGVPLVPVTETPLPLPRKRQLSDLKDVPELVPGDGNAGPPVADMAANKPTAASEGVEASPSRTLPEFPYVYSPVVPLNHKDFVQTRIQDERLPPGITRIGARNYLLRPEAIESVWYMYRITGDNHWREAGWRMFLAIENHTSTVYGNSAIDDVTKQHPGLNDEMESFWLAETLKYFYLLFEDEDVINLDEWVLNTEAHPFRRPK